MIVRRVRAHPFGCLSETSVSFAPGLNVVLGPNEAGKSTIFHAIRHALFVPTRLSKKAFEQKVAPYLPAAGGDTIRVELELDTTEGPLLLKRTWGGRPASELVLATGGVVSDEAAIGKKLGELLPATPGAVANILMTEQSALAATLDTLQGNGGDSLSDLTDILRRAVLSTGGISVERFVAHLAEEGASAWSHWDRGARGPEGGRGPETRWKKEVGRVLAAWYAAEEARASCRKAGVHDTAVDEVNALLRAVGGARGARNEFVSRNAAAARDARDRRTLEAELRAARGEAEALVRASVEWPVAAGKARELAEAAAAAEAARAPLEAELRAARAAEEARGLIERHERVRRRKTLLDEAAAALSALPRLERKALEEIRGAASALTLLSAGLEAGRISMTVAGRSEVEIVVQEDFNPEARRRLGPGEAARLRATGRVRLVHRDMEIEVRSGDADTDATAQKGVEAARALADLLGRHGVKDAAAAEERGRAWEAAAADMRAAEKNLAEELGSDTLAAVEARVAALAPSGTARPLAVVAAEIAAARAQAEARTREISELQRRMGEWETKHGTREELLAALAAVKGSEGELVSRIGRSAPLPAGYADADSFLRDFEKAQAELADRTAELRGLEERKRALEAGAPDQSAEELAVQAKEAEEASHAELRRAEALDRVQARSTELLGASQSSLFTGMRDRLSESLASMTEGAHAGVVMEGAVPVALSDGPGRPVTWDQLSAGTRDSLALALRLAMASFFIGEADGFMLIDDPLVDMDPDRQRGAASALKAFGAGRQIIVFTCHPATAELLRGNLVRMAPAP